MDSDTLECRSALAAPRNGKAGAVFDASAFGLRPANCGPKNGAAAKATLDAPSSADKGIIKILPNRTCEIGGDVVVTAPPSGIVTIAGNGGKVKLAEADETSYIYILGFEIESVIARHIVLKNLCVQGHFVQFACTTGSNNAEVFTLGTAENLGVRSSP